MAVIARKEPLSKNSGLQGLKELLKVTPEAASRLSAGRQIQRLEAATLKAPSPKKLQAGVGAEIQVGVFST